MLITQKRLPQGSLFIASSSGLWCNHTMKKLLLILLTLLVCAAPALAEIKITTSTQYYAVHGTTKGAINKSIRSNSPHEERGEPAAALTESELKYDYSWRNSNGRCRMEKFTVHLHLTYTYPRLAQTPRGKLRQWWERELKRYKEHEAIHGRISIKWATIIDKELRKLKSVNCATVKSTVESRIQYYARQLKNEQKKFDRITDHGRNNKRYRIK